MSDFSLKLTANALGKSLENLSASIEKELNQAISDLANASYASLISQVQSMSMNPKNRQDYLKGLQFQKLGENEYLIYLEGTQPNKLEDGFPPYDMRKELLKSEKVVKIGSRAGEKWVREAKDGHKYAAVPFEHKPHSAKSNDLASEIKNLLATNRQGSFQPIMETFKDDFGKPLSGKVAKAETNLWGLAGLTKYQSVSDKGKVTSTYMTYRIISENSSGWQHPGFEGYNLFEEAERTVQAELENIIKTLL